MILDTTRAAVAMVWYCMTCKQVLRSVPLLLARGCRCEVPQMPQRPTRVTW